MSNTPGPQAEVSITWGRTRCPDSIVQEFWSLDSCDFCQKWDKENFLERGTTSGESMNFVYISDATKCPLGDLGAEQSLSTKQTS